jgi:site-specific DNA recombinase
VKEWVVADREVSGRSLAGRNALCSLKEATKQNPRPFDGVLIDDTSRFGRNIADVLKLAEMFEHYGVSLHFVSPPLNSRDPNFKQLLMMKAWVDEAEKVLRGLEGQVLRGFNASGPCYGYKNVALADPSRKGDGIAGMRVEIIPEQADVVLRIFKEYASGLSLRELPEDCELTRFSLLRPRAKIPFAAGRLTALVEYFVTRNTLG